MFVRYTERTRRVLFFARYEASQFGSVVIQPEHLLLGLIREGKGLTTRILAHWNMSLDGIRKEIEIRTPVHEKVATSIEIPFSPETKRILQFTSEEAGALGDKFITTEHLLLAILREEQSLAARILIEKGMRLKEVREKVQRLLNESSLKWEPEPLPVLAAENARLRSVIEYLLEQQHLGRKLHFRDDAYWLQGEGDAGEGPYCAACWNIDRRLVRREKGANGLLYCEYCSR